MTTTRITVRSWVKAQGKWLVEWTKHAETWRAAWDIVDNCGASRDECSKERVVGGCWDLDIGRNG